MESIAELRRICQADKLQYSRGLTRLHRFVSIYATRVALTLRVSANTLTVASIGAGVAAAVLLALPDYAMNLAAVGLLYLSFLLDQVDGEVARYHRNCTLAGSYLDEIRHLIIYPAPVFAISMQFFQIGPMPLMAGAGFCASMSLVILRFNSNAKYLLFSKKMLLGRSGEVVFHTHVVSDPVYNTEAHTSHGRAGIRWYAQRVAAGIVYVITNQVSLLCLIALFVHLRWMFSGFVHQRIYLFYAAAVTMLGLLDVWGMAHRGRIEKGCVGLHRAIAEPDLSSDTRIQAAARVRLVASRNTP
jgi:CDP-alcohol phosphatidyltransferase